MLYTVVCKEPFVFLFNEDEEILKSDYDFVVENPEECNLSRNIIPVEYTALTPSEFSTVLDVEVIEGFIYTFEEGELVKRFYRQAPVFYVRPEDGIQYPTYCVNPNSIKSGLLTNKELLPILSGLVDGYTSGKLSDVISEVPQVNTADNGSILAYVCIPIVQKSIPIGRETEEERQEELEDQEDF